MEENLQIHLLGSIRVILNDQPVSGFESQKALALACYLAYVGLPISRSKLANLFWGNKTEQRGLANLSRVIHNNQKLLPGFWEINYKLIQFTNIEHSCLDARQFDELIIHHDPDHLIKAVDLYQGDFMEGISLADCPEFASWLASEQEQWRQKVASIYATLISILYQQGKYSEGIKYASRLLSLDPWHEEAHRQLMLLLAVNGQRMAAIQQYKLCCRVLEQDLGIEPSEETKALYEKILIGKRTSPSDAPLTSSIPYTAGAYYNFPTHLPQLKGSDIELDQIVLRVQNPACRLLTISGKGSPAQNELLALHAAKKASDKFADGVFYFKLPQDHIIEAFNEAITDTFSLPTQDHKSSLEHVYQFLKESEMLLVISNFEESLFVTRFLEGILRRSPNVKILITAPAPLGSSLEWIYDIPDIHEPPADDSSFSI